MEQEKYEAVRQTFFKSYKSFIDFIDITHDECSMYSILILKRKTHNNLSKVNIIIRNSYNRNGSYNEYSGNVILNNEEAENLINDIRDDFKTNHYIAYSSINPRNYIQTLQNTSFSLNIKLDTQKEYEEAVNFNNEINCVDNRVEKTFH